HVTSNVETPTTHSVQAHLPVASIEPRSFKRANPQTSCGLHAQPRASIEPRSFKRGNLIEIAHDQLGARASIEPRSFKRGNASVSGIATPGFFSLQLSHVHSNVETRAKASRLMRARML